MKNYFFVLIISILAIGTHPVIAGTLPSTIFPNIDDSACVAPVSSGGWGGECKIRALPMTDGCTTGGKFVGMCGGIYSNGNNGCCAPTESTTQGSIAGYSIPEDICKAPVNQGGKGGECKIRAFPGSNGCDDATESFVGTCRTLSSTNANGCCVPKGSAGDDTPTYAESSLGRLNYTLLEEIPGQGGAGGDLGSYLEGLYKFTFWAIGIAALFMLTIGGFMYVTSAGNTSRLGTAKTIIVDSFLGIIIALFAWLFLYVLNPDLVEGLRLPGLTTIDTPTATGTTPTTPSASCPSTPNTSASCCPASASVICQACTNCVAIPSSVPNKGCGLSTCFLESSLLRKIQSVTNVSGWRITESWPPTVKHLSTCHTNGTCADINNTGGGTDPDTIKTYYDAFRAAGLNVTYENSNDCAPYTAKGINCQRYSTQTSVSSFHVK